MDRLRAVRGALALRMLDPADPALDEQTLGAFLRRHGQNDATIGSLWGIVATATLNLRPDDASLALAAKVFRTGLLDHADAADVGYAAVPLGALHSTAAMRALEAAGVEVLLGHRVESVGPDGAVLASGPAGARTRQPDALVLEITETTLVEDFEHCQQVLARLAKLAVEVSIDDFGAGFTSLTYLSALTVDELKLDRSFITPLSARGAREVELVRATIALGHALGLRVVAEGIEDAETLQLLAELGCDLAQGYFISMPQPAEQLTFEQHRVGSPAFLAA